MKSHVTPKWTFLFAALVLVLFAAEMSAALPAQLQSQCASLFSSRGREPQEFPILRTPSFPSRSTPILSDSQLLEIFKDVPMYSREYGRRAVAYMKTLPKHYDGETRAYIWMEMAVFIVSFYRIPFVSDLYRLPEGRFLFRGGLGETLFIERDGATYRTRTEDLYFQKTWIADYSVLTPL